MTDNDLSLHEPDDVPAPAAGEQERPGLRDLPPPPGLRRMLGARDRVVLALILLITAATYFARLGAPGVRLGSDAEECAKYPPLGEQCYEMIPLDEVHYVPDARDVIRFGTESDTRVPTDDDGAFVVHPPVGKWFIAAGIKIFGDRPIGWRAFGALFGVLGVLLVYLIALRLWASPWYAAMAAVLLALDGLWFVQSRIAMLDIYAAVFALAGVWLLFEDRARTLGATHRRWAVAAGVAFGLALATKWSAAPFWVVALGIAVGNEIVRARYSVLPVRAHRATLAVAMTMIVVPALVYVGSYTPWFADGHRYHPPLCQDIDPSREASTVRRTMRTIEDNLGVFGQWICYQEEILGFHRHLAKYEDVEPDEDAPATATVERKPAHPYFGHGISWPWIGRPAAHAYDVTGENDAQRAREVLGIPNPASWWPAFFLGIPLLALAAIRRRDRTASMLLLFIVAGWAPYVLADLFARPVFLFYATPLVPFLVLGLVHAFRRSLRRFPALRWRAPVLYLALVAVSFAYFYPVMASAGIPMDAWRARIIWKHCDDENRIKLACWI